MTGKVAPPLPRGLVIDGPALLEAMRTPESQGALLRAAQVREFFKVFPAQQNHDLLVAVSAVRHHRGLCVPFVLILSFGAVARASDASFVCTPLRA